MKKIMILGASQLQLPAILKAKEMGLYVIAIDMNSNAIGVKYADEFHEISTIDENRVLEKAIELKIDGIITLASDMPMRAVAKVGDVLGLNTISYASAIKSTDKSLMREAFKDFGAPIPNFFIAKGYDEVLKNIGKLDGKIILKPSDSSGSRGIILLDNETDIKKAYEYAKSYSKSGIVLVEEFVSGHEVSVEVIVWNNDINIIAITDKITTGSPYFVEMGHTQPSRLSKQEIESVEDATKQGIRALGINNSPAHVEIMVTKQGARIIEIGARLGGDNITTHLVPLSTGVDIVKASIMMALGIEPDILPIFSKGSAIRYLNCKLGLIGKITNKNSFSNREEIKEIVFMKKEGEIFSEIKSSNDRLGYVIVQGEDADNAEKIAQVAMENIEIEMREI